MKKLFIPLFLLGFTGITVLSTSCQKIVPNRFEYLVENDTIAPVISVTVPAMNQSYAYGDDVAIVGTVTDLESEKTDLLDPGFRKGKLKSLSIEVENLTTPGYLLKKYPDVDGKDGYAFNEKFGIIQGTGIINCRLILVAVDYKNMTTRDTVLFQYQ